MATIALRYCFELILGLLESPGCFVDACGVARASTMAGYCPNNERASAV